MNEGIVTLEKLLKVPNDSIYKVTILAAKRAMNLSDGDKPLVEKPGEKVLDNALREIGAGKIRAKKSE
jgi:DNA-directed RNA polymerase subunit omega